MAIQQNGMNISSQHRSIFKNAVGFPINKSVFGTLLIYSANLLILRISQKMNIL